MRLGVTVPPNNLEFLQHCMGFRKPYLFRSRTARFPELTSKQLRTGDRVEFITAVSSFSSDPWLKVDIAPAIGSRLRPHSDSDWANNGTALPRLINIRTMCFGPAPLNFPASMSDPRGFPYGN